MNEDENITSIAEYMQRGYLMCARPRCRAWHPVAKPEGARPGQMYVCSEIADGARYAGTGVEDGDFLIILVTSSVQAGDLIALRWRGISYTGFLEIDGGRWLLTDAEGEPKFGPFDADPLNLIGRCVEVQRRCKRVRIVRALRPADAAREAA